MNLRSLSVNRLRWLWAVMLVTGLSISQPGAADSDLENARLAALVRQLDALDRHAAQSAASSPANTRYHFDYARLRNDIARMRAGIEEYLSPRRAQPRDPEALSGDYRHEGTTAP